ncbi:hypothetical protein HpKG72_02350 [Helicobacter pylori]
MFNLYIAEKASMGRLIASALSNDYNAPLLVLRHLAIWFKLFPHLANSMISFLLTIAFCFLDFIGVCEF